MPGYDTQTGTILAALVKVNRREISRAPAFRQLSLRAQRGNLVAVGATSPAARLPRHKRLAMTKWVIARQFNAKARRRRDAKGNFLLVSLRAQRGNLVGATDVFPAARLPRHKRLAMTKWVIARQFNAKARSRRDAKGNFLLVSLRAQRGNLVGATDVFPATRLPRRKRLAMTVGLSPGNLTQREIFYWCHCERSVAISSGQRTSFRQRDCHGASASQ